MDFLGLIVLGLGLAMDSFAVTISDAAAYPSERRAKLWCLPLVFGLFQGGLPGIGYVLSGLASSLIEDFGPIVALIVLGIIGANMIREGVVELRGHTLGSAGPGPEIGRLSVALILTQGVATAIDAFAVGVSLRALGTNIWLAMAIIAAVTWAACVVALLVGLRLGEALGTKAKIVGGFVLVGIGIHVLLA